MQSDAQVRLVFSGEILPGFQPDDVMRRFGEKFKVEGARLAAMFSGEPTVLKRALAYDDAVSYLAQLQKYGLRVRMEPVDGAPAAKAAPKPASKPAPTPPSLAPLAAAAGTAPSPAIPATPALALAEEQITCPNCGETQSMRVLCRSCATDMPRGIAAKKEDADRLRAERLEAARARRGLPPSGFQAAGHDEDAPGLLGFGFEGRLSRLSYISAALITWIALVWLGTMMLTRPGIFTGLLFTVGLLMTLVWSLRVSVLRLHDFNASGWWAVMAIVPYIGEALSLALIFIPGSRDDNDHGGLPRPGSKLMAGILVVLFVLSVAAAWRPVMRAFDNMLSEVDEQTETFEGVNAAGPAPSDAQLAQRIRHSAARGGFSDEYWNLPDNKAFAASDDGAWGVSGGESSPRQAASVALSRCDEKRKAYTRPCALVSVNGMWVKER